jgi:hypothetical protein
VDEACLEGFFADHLKARKQRCVVGGSVAFNQCRLEGFEETSDFAIERFESVAGRSQREEGLREGGNWPASIPRSCAIISCMALFTNVRASVPASSGPSARIWAKSVVVKAGSHEAMSRSIARQRVASALRAC